MCSRERKQNIGTFITIIQLDNCEPLCRRHIYRPFFKGDVQISDRPLAFCTRRVQDMKTIYLSTDGITKPLIKNEKSPFQIPFTAGFFSTVLTINPVSPFFKKLDSPQAFLRGVSTFYFLFHSRHAALGLLIRRQCPRERRQCRLPQPKPGR